MPAGELLRTLFGGLVAVAALGALLYFGLRAARRGPLFSGRDARGLLEVVASTAVGPRRSILLVRAANRYLVLGVTEQAISFLAETERPEPGTSPAEGFAVTLRERLGRLRAGGGGG